MSRATPTAGWVLAALLTFTGCTAAASDEPARPVAAAPAATTTTTTSTSSTTSTSTTTTLPPPPPRSVSEQAWTPFATAGPITLHHPARLVERVGFHQSNHEGARAMTVLDTAVSPLVLESRERLTAGATAADVVVDPGAEIRSPVTGTVKRSGGYTLYCKYRDDYLVIAPDALPGWEVKLLHITGVRVRAGERVVAGETVVAPAATPLPFASQVDEVRTADPAWPHVHVEVVDPSIPNVASPGGGCS
jgi:hypothetical protein